MPLRMILLVLEGGCLGEVLGTLGCGEVREPGDVSVCSVECPCGGRCAVYLNYVDGAEGLVYLGLTLADAWDEGFDVYRVSEASAKYDCAGVLRLLDRVCELGCVRAAVASVAPSVKPTTIANIYGSSDWVWVRGDVPRLLRPVIVLGHDPFAVDGVPGPGVGEVLGRGVKYCGGRLVPVRCRLEALG